MVEENDRKYRIGAPDFTPLKRTKAQKAHFFLNQKLYKMLRQDRAADLLTAWDYEDKRMVTFVLSDAKRSMRNAYDSTEVARILNRKPDTVKGYAQRGVINEPVKIFSYGKNKYGHPFTKMKWSEDDILALHTYLLTAGGGRPRKDGTLYSAARLPTRQEVLAMMRNQPMFYMRTATGDFVPVWSAHGEV